MSMVSHGQRSGQMRAHQICETRVCTFPMLDISVMLSFSTWIHISCFNILGICSSQILVKKKLEKCISYQYDF